MTGGERVGNWEPKQNMNYLYFDNTHENDDDIVILHIIRPLFTLGAGVTWYGHTYAENKSMGRQY